MSHPITRAAGAASKHARRSIPTATPIDGDRALADIRAWTQLLVARGNRLLELAVRERQENAREQRPSQIQVRGDAPSASRSAARTERGGRKHPVSKPLA
jgi:hypothetical protein